MIAGIIAIVICVPLGVVAIRAAKSAPPNRSKVHAVVGWLIGFFIVDAALLAIVRLIDIVGG
jgi:hypothetical protein